MAKRQNTPLLIAGILLSASSIALVNRESLTDTTRGLVAGMGFGFLILNLIISQKKKKTF